MINNSIYQMNSVNQMIRKIKFHLTCFTLIETLFSFRIELILAQWTILISALPLEMSLKRSTYLLVHQRKAKFLSLRFWPNIMYRFKADDLQVCYNTFRYIYDIWPKMFVENMLSLAEAYICILQYSSITFFWKIRLLLKVLYLLIFKLWIKNMT